MPDADMGAPRAVKLIKEVEVAYFRSIYKEQVSNCSNTNILFGRNDSGKSNFLRAINLFLIMKLTLGSPSISSETLTTLVELKQKLRQIFGNLST